MKTYFTNEIKNPYCEKGNFLWKHNDDTKLGENNDDKLEKIKQQEDKRFAREMRKDSNSPVGRQLMRDIAFRGYRYK